MLLKIYRDSAIIAYVRPDDNSELVQKLMTDDLVKLSFTHSSYIDLQIGDNLLLNGLEYRLNSLPNYTKASANEHKYECQFQGGIYELQKASFLLYSDFYFDFTGNAQGFLNLCITNLNRDLGGYSAGTCDVTEVKTLTFDNMSVLEAIDYIKDELGFEFYLAGKVLHFTAPGVDTGLTFKVGRFQGLYELTRKKVESANIITRLWAYGSQNNLPPDYVSPLVHKRLAFENALLNNESRVESNVALYRIREAVKVFDDIKPERIGTVTGIDTENNRVFIDTAMDFDLNAYLLAGLTPKANFKTGALAGITFDLSYDHGTQTFTVDYFTDESGTYPNETLKFAIGDQYVLFDIWLPPAYVTDAESRLKTAAEAWLAKYDHPNAMYELNNDEAYVRDNAISFTLGDSVTITDADLAINGLIRITGISRNIANPDKYKLDVGELMPTPLLKSIGTQLKNAQAATQSNAVEVQSVKLKKADTTSVFTQAQTLALLDEVNKKIYGGTWDSVFHPDDLIDGGDL